ncbi:MAG TPA: NF038122 family metalloprotease, partial [Candidatus Acidoferrales bacterium]|nr:NF038122 family metalloprotease [Candidatus Acidoferrales bacterium]
AAPALPPPMMTGLTIIPIFDGSITSDPEGATIMNTINTAITFYESNITDPITVVIKFKKMSSGLGRSSTFVTCRLSDASLCFEPLISYSSFETALTSHATSVDDATSLAFLPPGPNNPVNGNANVVMTLPNARALGFTADAPPGNPDSTISLHTKICNLDRSSIDPSKYDLLAVVEHEIDEVLGLGSALNGLPNNAPAPTGPVYPEDLFRYDQLAARSWNTMQASQAFFSLNGTTQLARFNQTAGGDYQDWFSDGPHTPQVQDAFGTPGATPDPGVELTALDVVGYALGSATPPSQDDDSGFIPPDAGTETCEVGVANNVKNLEACIEGCHITASTKAFKLKMFDEESCETSCRNHYNNKQTRLLTPATCPACLDATHQTSLADSVQSDLDTNNGTLFCSGGTALGDDDSGFIAPDADTLACETGVANNLKKLNLCLRKCHVNAAIKAFKGKPFDEEGCEENDPKKSCRAKYDTKQAKLVNAGTCPACLGAAQQAALADQALSNLDAGNGAFFCAGSTPLPPPW